jgi:hypothetical protein
MLAVLRHRRELWYGSVIEWTRLKENNLQLEMSDY